MDVNRNGLYLPEISFDATLMIVSFPRLIYALIFILAFCSIVYELLLAQSLAAFLENTVLRYCVTIGIYMFSMGLGSLAAKGKYTKHPVVTLLSVEILLTIIGGCSLLFLHVLNMAGMPRIIFSASAHILIIGIGILTGFEIPLFFEILRDKKEAPENLVLGINYFGAFIGTICFALIFYPIAGLMATTFLIGSLNGLAGISLIKLRPLVDKAMEASFNRLLLIQGVIFAAIGVCLIFSGPINEYFMMNYLNNI